MADPTTPRTRGRGINHLARPELRPRLALGLDVAELVVDPVAGVARGHDLLEALRTPAALLPRHGEGAIHRVRLLLDVERVDRQRVLAELLVSTRVLRQQADAVALVHERALLRHQ